jgi:uncharacterized membrane protein YeiB
MASVQEWCSFLDMKRRRFPEGLFAMVAPLVLWAGHLLFVYGVLAAVCALRPEAGAATLPILWLATGVVVSALVFLGAAQYRRLPTSPRQHGESSAHGLALTAGPIISLISLVAVVWTALPLVFIAPCV